MTTPSEYVIYTDGGARGNPGPASYALVIQQPDGTDFEDMGYLGKTTNNIAEYTALVRALEWAKEFGAQRLLIQSDSELMVHQMNGVYKVKNEGLIPLYQKAKDLAKHFERVQIRHIRREMNKRADALCNEVLDNPSAYTNWSPARPSPTTPAPAATKPKDTPPAKPADFQQHARATALAYLKECAHLWAKGDPEQPAPSEVLEQIWTILKEGR